MPSFLLKIILAISAFQLSGRVICSPNTAFSSRSDSHIVDVGYAKYLGNFTEPFSLAFLGVPYAEPPIRDLRFRAPVPLDTDRLRGNDQVIDTMSYPDFCIQGSTGGGDAGGAGSEDCLKINIYTPVNATSRSKLPVLFYIHGGGYVYGNPRNWPFEHWINQSPNVVIVSVYYRLDSFGFLAHPAFSNPSIADFNVGIKDQVLALQWVQDNIAAFGGDPDQVTINGQSAGGGSVEIHLIADEGPKRLFSAGESHSLLLIPKAEVFAALKPLFDFYAEQAGCRGFGSVEETISCLRNAPISALARAQDTGASFNGSYYKGWLPTVDGKLIPDYPTKLLAEGKFAHVPLTVLQRNDELRAYNKVYDRSQFSSDDEWIRTATGEPSLRCGRVTVGFAGVKHSKAWTYRYNQPNPTQNEPGITEHAAENWMMFLGTNTGFNGTNVFTGLNGVEKAFSEELIAYWLSFVRVKDPNKFKLARSAVWPDFSSGRRVVLQQSLDNETSSSSIFVEKEFVGDTKRCAFVASLVNHMQN
ncbi:alpha/beta-hydrolase [Sanghuangporus baumii]|uniref:Carboxylic ester hydrolase n=1 Tax=Sanghuangporus baumii TaxID=108892 RepID=A0A9Q5I2S4_SANBA|nr:alpha/beta-hydrolase [Sanghuangporus baumii]